MSYTFQTTVLRIQTNLAIKMMPFSKHHHMVILYFIHSKQPY